MTLIETSATGQISAVSNNEISLTLETDMIDMPEFKMPQEDISEGEAPSRDMSEDEVPSGNMPEGDAPSGSISDNGPAMGDRDGREALTLTISENTKIYMYVVGIVQEVFS